MALTLDDVAQHVLRLEGVRETSCNGQPRWYRRNRIVARPLDDRFLVIRSDFPAREQLLTDHGETFSVPPRFERHQMVVADLRDGDADAIRSTLDAAHALQAP